MNDPDDLDKDTARSAWLCTVKILIPNLINHDDPDAEPDPATVAMELIEEDNGFAGFCDWPEHYRILNFVPYSQAAWRDAVKTRNLREKVTIRSFIEKVRARVGATHSSGQDEGVTIYDIWEAMEAEYAKITSTP